MPGTAALNSTVIDGSVNYCTRAGICTVRMIVTIKTSVSETPIADGLPLPAIEPRFIIEANGSIGTGHFYVNNDGTLIAASASIGAIYYMTFSYPIA